MRISGGIFSRKGKRTRKIQWKMLYANIIKTKIKIQRYMVFLIVFTLLFVPSTNPLLKGLATAFLTASISRSNPLANDAISFIDDWEYLVI